MLFKTFLSLVHVPALLTIIIQDIPPTIAMMISTSTSTMKPKYFVGFDLGTSGCRISIIEKGQQQQQEGEGQSLYNQVYSDSTLYSSYDDPHSWMHSIKSLLSNTPLHYLQLTKSICVSGTSASCLIVNSKDCNFRHPKMYDYDVSQDINNSKEIDPTGLAFQKTKDVIEKYVPSEHPTRSSTSALSKLLHYHYCKPLLEDDAFVHQSEYVATTFFLSESKISSSESSRSHSTHEYISDWHNALKLGYDVRTLSYPQWLLQCVKNELKLNPKQVLPKVVAPGEIIGSISSSVSREYKIHPDAVIVGGTTDSNAAFVAATSDGHDGVPTYGTAVTSLGSTLAIKMLSKSYVESASQGVYSHRFPIFGSRGLKTNANENKKEEEELWLVGGASNVGCAILRQEKFSNEELISLSQDIDVQTDSSLVYYPLTRKGERFPIADGSKEPIMTPKPESRSEYLKAILQGITLVEKQGFEVLGSLGADPSYPNIVSTCGGGSMNDTWIQMRQRILKERDDGSVSDVKVIRASNSEASFGAAVLAASSFS